MDLGRDGLLDSDAIARVAQALSYPTRVRIVAALLETPSTTTDLTVKLRGRQPRISSHLAVLRNAGLVTVAAIGRQRVYAVDPSRMRSLLRALGLRGSHSVPERKPDLESTPGVRADSPIRLARTCYDHLAGVAGVVLLDRMLAMKWLVEKREGERPSYELTRTGESALEGRGTLINKSAHRRFAYGCPDWTERRDHLGGELGRAVLDALTRAGLVRRGKRTRAVSVQGSVEGWLISKREKG